MAFHCFSSSASALVLEPTTALSMTSDMGDYIGAGQNYIYGPTSGTYTPRASDQNGDGIVDYVEIALSGQNGDWWYLDFSSRLAGRNLAPGFYDNAMRYPFESGNHPGLSIYGNGRGCNTLSGNFTVHDAEFNYASTPIQVVRFTATFEQHCEGGTTAFYGTVYYNYTPAGPTYSVTGQVVNNIGNPVAGTPVSLFGSRSAATITDANGHYSFDQLLDQGTFRVVPTDTNFSASPTNRIFTRLSANQTADFTLIPYYKITGQVLNELGSPLTSVTVRLTGSQTRTVSTDSQGKYSFDSLLANGNYTVTPSRTFYTFDPASRSFNTLPGNQAADFLGNIARYSISGRILDSFGAGLSGVRVGLSGGSQSLTATTDNNGIYSFEGVPAGSDYQLHPTSNTYVFSPQTQYFYSLDRNYSNVFFTGSVSARYSVSGFTLDGKGNPIPGATVSLTGSSSLVTTSDVNGFFTFDSLPAGVACTVTPRKTGFSFAPTSRTTTSLNSNVYFNFIASPRLSIADPGRIDFDGDGKTDISIFRPSVGEWWYSRSSDGAVKAGQFGNSTDVITPGDFTGDGKADWAFFRPSDGFWFILRSEDGSFFSFPFGSNGDIPMPADFDGDGKTDAAVFRPSSGTWFILQSGGGGTAIVPFGSTGDKPVAFDYDGDGKADIGIVRDNATSGNKEWWIQRSNLGILILNFGIPGDKTVPGDYTGDGKADVAFFRPSSGFWYILRSEDFSFFSFGWGQAGDVPAPGDYDGDGKTDAAVFRPSSSTWFVNRTGGQGPLITGFGASTDNPVPSSLVR
jgi:hypothetical protein